MSELIQNSNCPASIRWRFLASASALALMGHVASPTLAIAEDSDHPSVWIELGGQLSRLGDSSEAYEPDFTSARPANFSPSSAFEKSPRYSFDEYGKVSLHPDNSNWVLSAAVRYGRSTSNKHVRQQTYPSKLRFNFYATMPSNPAYYERNPRAAKFSDTLARNNEQHLMVDFQVGKDVGLGLFGRSGSSLVSLGVRFAQFVDKSNISLKSDPDWHFKMKYYYYSGIKIQWPVQPYHSNAAGLIADRSFRGLGPELSWSASVPFAGNASSAELDFDWGVNAAVLFGRQKTRTEHHETARYNDGGTGFILFSSHNQGTLATVYRHTHAPQNRSRNVIVPNIGGFAGLSFKYSAAKVSFGYKADFFFGAMDGGIDTRKTYDRNFYGPYATISIGLGG